MKINCECNNEEAQIRWVRGNTQPLAIPLEQEVMTENEEIRTEPYYPSESDKVTVYLVGRFKRKAFTPEIDGNVLIIHEDGTLSTGSYHVEVLIEHQDGTRNRSLWCNQVVITESNDTVLEEWDEFKQQEPQARAAIFFFAKGDKGDPFTYEDFTQEQIEDLKKPAVDAAAELTDEVHALESEFTESENERVANENQRKANEISRVNAETSREQQSASDHTTALADHTTSVSDHTTAQSDHTTALSDHTQASSDHVTANGDHTRAKSDHALAATDHTTATSDHQTAVQDNAQMTELVERADADHVQAAADHATAESDHTTATSDHAQAATDHNAATSDHNTATSDHATASTDHATAQSDHTTATNDHDTATTDHQTAVSDHSIADGDHTLASADHTAAVAGQTQAASDHTRAENDNATATSDHSRAVGDHITAAEDHTQAVSDHTTAAADHTTAESDHAAVEVYVDSLGVFDLSKHNAVGGVLATYADLSAALTALNALDSKYKYGGMSFKFVRTSDNKYVQYRYMLEYTNNTAGNAAFVDEANWAFMEGDVYIDAPEYIKAETDAVGHLLFWIKIDGSIDWAIGVPKPIKDYVDSLITEIRNGNEGTDIDGLNKIIAFLDDFSTSDTLAALLNMKVDKIEGKSLVDEDYASSLFTIEDPEGRCEVTTDSEGRIISYRDADGVLHENVGIETDSATVNHLNLTAEGMTEFQQALIDSGFNPGGICDWSKASEIILPIPGCLAKINFIADSLPVTKTDDKKGYVEYYDRDGNYFKKPIKKFNLQGSTSLLAPKKNYAIDFVDCTVKFGDKATQDSYHFKANYYDVVRGKSNLAYNMWLELLGYNKSYINTKPWLIVSENDYSTTTGKKAFDADFGMEARCTPYGFPVECYFNGEYMGLFTMNIKKHRDNYNMNKKTATHIHIDPDSISALFTQNIVPWTEFEIRNPKDLKYQVPHTDPSTGEDTLDYDADIAQAEIMGTNSQYYDAEDANCVRSAEVKTHILDFCHKATALNNSPTKGGFEEIFDIPWMIDFFLWSNLLLDRDGVYRNTQWITYDGIKWFPCPYDCDQIFGNVWYGNYIITDYDNQIIGYDFLNQPFASMFTLYSTEFKARYNELKQAGLYTKDYVMGVLKKYMSLIGKVAYKKEFELWNESPCYRKPNVNNGWVLIGEDYGSRYPLYNAETTYYKDDVIEQNNFVYKATADTITGISPQANMYSKTPQAGGFYDSLARMEKWLDVRISVIDNFFNNL